LCHASYFEPVNPAQPDVSQVRYAVDVAFPGGKRRMILAFLSICSFVTIFIVGIIWATRPAKKDHSKEHGTTQHPGSI